MTTSLITAELLNIATGLPLSLKIFKILNGTSKSLRHLKLLSISLTIAKSMIIAIITTTHPFLIMKITHLLKRSIQTYQSTRLIYFDSFQLNTALTLSASHLSIYKKCRALYLHLSEMTIKTFAKIALLFTINNLMHDSTQRI